MRIMISRLIALGLLASSACSPGGDRETPVADENSEEPAAPETAAPEVSDDQAEVATQRQDSSPGYEIETAFARDDVQALLDGWIAAQNAGEFEAVGEFYAPQFLGIDRSIPDRFEFDRARWLTHRRAAVEGATVEATEVEISMARDIAVVRFQQKVTSERFDDIDYRQLVLLWNGEELQIGREETVPRFTAVHRRVDERRPMRARPVITLDSGHYMILSDEIPEGAELGPVVAEEHGVSASRAVRRSRGQGGVAQARPEDVAGGSFRLRNVDGQICDGRMGTHRVLSRMNPHPNLTAAWMGTNPQSSAPVRQIATEVFELGSRVLVGQLHVDSECDDPIWAVPAGNPALHYRTGEVQDVVRRDASAAMMESTEWRRMQRAFETEYGGEGNWHESEGAEFNVTGFGDNRGPTHIVVTAAAGPGCGEFRAELTGIFRVSGEGADRTIGERRVYHEALLHVGAMFQTEGLDVIAGDDGIWEIGQTQLYLRFPSVTADLDTPC